MLPAARLIALCTLVSRIAGLARDTLLAQFFGLGWIADAFAYAFQFPNLFRRLFGEGSLAAVFVPTFTRTLEHEGKPAAWELLARTLTLITVALLVVLLAVEIILAAIWFFVPVDPAQVEARRLLLGLTALMMPFMVTVCLLALFSAILNCLGSFVPAALAPVVLNICIIAGLLWLAPGLAPGHDDAARVRQAYLVAASVLGAGVLQLLFIWPALRRHGVLIGRRWEPRAPAVQHMLRLLPPVALGQGVLAFGVFLDSQICILLTHKAGGPAEASWFGGLVQFPYPLDEGALAALSYAQRLYQFPLGVLAISLATAALPSFTRLAARGDWGAWAGEVRFSLRMAAFEGLLAGLVMLLAAEPIVRLLFQYGRFDAADTIRTGHVLAWYGIGLWAFCAQHMVSRAFYSVGDVQTPLRISVAVLPLNILIMLTLVWFESIRESAFAIASAVTAGLAVGAGLVILRRRHARELVNPEVFFALLRMVAAAGLAGGAVIVGMKSFAVLGDAPISIPARAIQTFGLIGLAVGVYVGAAFLLRLPEATHLLPRLRRRPRGENQQAGD